MDLAVSVNFLDAGTSGTSVSSTSMDCLESDASEGWDGGGGTRSANLVTNCSRVTKRVSISGSVIMKIRWSKIGGCSSEIRDRHSRLHTPTANSAADRDHPPLWLVVLAKIVFLWFALDDAEEELAQIGVGRLGIAQNLAHVEFQVAAEARAKLTIRG